MIDVPYATEIMMSLAALIGGATAVILAMLTLWRKVLRPIQTNVRDELEHWAGMREAVGARFETDLGNVGMTVALRHVIAGLSAIEERLTRGDERFADITSEQVQASERGKGILDAVEALREEVQELTKNIVLSDIRRGTDTHG